MFPPKPVPSVLRRQPATDAPSVKPRSPRCAGMEKYNRFGYISKTDTRRILKRKDFAKWQLGEQLPDAFLCKVVRHLENGLIDADLGGLLYKMRLARPGQGKSRSYRTLLSAHIGNRYVFLHGLAKHDKANITADEHKALQFAGHVFLELSGVALAKALQTGVLTEVQCEQDH